MSTTIRGEIGRVTCRPTIGGNLEGGTIKNNYNEIIRNLESQSVAFFLQMCDLSDMILIRKVQGLFSKKLREDLTLIKMSNEEKLVASSVLRIILAIHWIKGEREVQVS